MSGTSETVAVEVMPSPLGPLRITVGARGVRRVDWFDPGADVLLAPDSSGPAAALVARVRAQLDEYFAGVRTSFDLPIDVQGTPFQRRAWGVLVTIPYGTTITYGQQAAAMGAPTATRAVGGANGRNPVPVIVPCHRVIGADGSLTGFAGRLDLKAWLLDHERRHSQPD